MAALPSLGPTKHPRSGIFVAESDLHCDLEVLDVLAVDVTPDFVDFEPVEMAERPRHGSDAVVDGGIDAVGRRPDDMGDRVRVVFAHWADRTQRPVVEDSGSWPAC